MLPICFIALGVMVAQPGGSVPGQAIIRKDAIASMVSIEAQRPNGPRFETRITLQGDAKPLYTLFKPSEVIRLPCRDYYP